MMSRNRPNFHQIDTKHIYKELSSTDTIMKKKKIDNLQAICWALRLSYDGILTTDQDTRSILSWHWVIKLRLALLATVAGTFLERGYLRISLLLPNDLDSDFLIA